MSAYHSHHNGKGDAVTHSHDAGTRPHDHHNHDGDFPFYSLPEQWPAYCIDWDWEARELQHDYTAVDHALRQLPRHPRPTCDDHPGGAMSGTYKVTTWADAFGLWHATIRGDITVAQRQRIARQAILREIQERQLTPVGNVRIRHEHTVTGTSFHTEEDDKR